MTREEAIYEIKQLAVLSTKRNIDRITEALEMAIEALQSEVWKDEPQTEMTTEQIVNELLSIKQILDDGKLPKQTHDIRTNTHECVKDTHDKTEPSNSEKPNNCEPTPWCKYCQRRWENNCVGVAQCIRDMQMIAELYKASEDEPQTNGYQTFNGTSVYVSRFEDEPQTERSNDAE